MAELGNPFAIGLGNRMTQPDNLPLQACEEMLINGCGDGSPTEGCCKISLCEFCLTWEVYGKEDKTGTASWNGTEWTGSAGGIQFTAWIGRDYDGPCTFYVELNGTLVFSSLLCGEYAEVSCRNLSGESPYTHDGEDGTFRWTKKIVHQLQPRLGAAPGNPCNVDVAIVLDSQLQNAAAIEDLQGGTLQPLVDWLEANTSSYRLSLITFQLSGGAWLLPFTLNNGTEFLTAIDAIVPTENASPGSNARASAEAMLTASSLVWRPTAGKLCVLLNQGVPLDQGGQASTAQTMNLAGIETNTITTPYWSGGVPTFEGSSQEANEVTATAGGGTHEAILSDGIDDHNGGTVLLPSAIKSLVDSTCPPDGKYRCARPFCGACNCTCDKLCVTVTRDDGIICKGILDFSGEMCNGKATTAEWTGAAECLPAGSIDVTVALKRNDYTDECELSGSATGTVDGDPMSGDLDAVTVSDCESLSASWTFESNYESYAVSVDCLDCGECRLGHPTPCCIAPLPDTLYAKLVNDFNSACVEAAGIITLSWVPTDLTPVPQFGTGNGGGWIGSAAIPCFQGGATCIKFWCSLVSSNEDPSSNDCISFVAQVDTACLPSVLGPCADIVVNSGTRGNAGAVVFPGCECTDPDELVEQLYVVFGASLSTPSCRDNPLDPIAGYHLEVAENPDDLP